MRVLFAMLFSLAILAGCSSVKPHHNEPARIIQNEVKWQNNTYIVGETLTADRIGKQIGAADDSQMTNCVECKSPPIHKGDRLYEINGVDIQESIAAESSVGTYYRLNKRK